MKSALLTAIVVLVSAVATNAFAQKYPTKPIRLISPFAPGGGTDILSRVIAIPLSKSLGQPVVVDNRPGAGGALGAELTAHAEPDGYSLVMVSSSYTATAAYHKVSYDPVNGIQPIILIGTTGLVMFVHPSVPAKNVKELIDHAKANPGKVNYATVGTGSVTHLAHEQFRLTTGINIVHIPYKGGGPALTAVVAGEAQLSAISVVPTLPHVRAGRLRAIGITTPTRSSLLPDVPTISETVPGFEVVHWYGIWGPKGLPGSIVTRWNREVAKVLLTDEMKRQMQGEGLEPGGGAPEELLKIIRRDVEKWRRVVKEAKIPREG
jgi:tripartite-type tricarboxylate transporter receptor subunit TctC